jgi:hypothetical protein
VRLGPRGFFESLLVISFAVMLSGHFMTFGGVLVMFGRFVVGVLGHVKPPLSSCNLPKTLRQRHRSDLKRKPSAASSDRRLT